jgi:membrane protease YdiL (CAAX protease family)
VISAVVIAPIVEETVFRGLVQTALLQWGVVPNRWAVIVIASVLFTAIHLGLEPVALPGLFVLSLGLGYVYERTGSIGSCIVVHAVFNAMNVALVFAGVVEA